MVVKEIEANVFVLSNASLTLKISGGRIVSILDVALEWVTQYIHCEQADSIQQGAHSEGYERWYGFDGGPSECLGVGLTGPHHPALSTDVQCLGCQ
jgi:hypothetical protein